jgi:hypothetical protein
MYGGVEASNSMNFTPISLKAAQQIQVTGRGRDFIPSKIRKSGKK